jgi:hypothetical protein
LYEDDGGAAPLPVVARDDDHYYYALLTKDENPSTVSSLFLTYTTTRAPFESTRCYDIFRSHRRSYHGGNLFISRINEQYNQILLCGNKNCAVEERSRRKWIWVCKTGNLIIVISRRDVLW